MAKVFFLTGQVLGQSPNFIVFLTHARKILGYFKLVRGLKRSLKDERCEQLSVLGISWHSPIRTHDLPRCLKEERKQPQQSDGL